MDNTCHYQVGDLLKLANFLTIVNVYLVTFRNCFHENALIWVSCISYGARQICIIISFNVSFSGLLKLAIPNFKLVILLHVSVWDWDPILLFNMFSNLTFPLGVKIKL